MTRALQNLTVFVRAIILHDTRTSVNDFYNKNVLWNILQIGKTYKSKRYLQNIPCAFAFYVRIVLINRGKLSFLLDHF